MNSNQQQSLATKLAGSRSFGIILLIAIVVSLGYALYTYQLKPAISMKIPEHHALPPDRPPVELTSFQIREGSRIFQPTDISIANDSIFISIAATNQIYLYSGMLELLGKIKLNQTQPISPTAIVVGDTVMIVADSSKGIVALYDRAGYYLSSVSWYPDSSARILPVDLSANQMMMAVTDTKQSTVSLISLYEQKPFFSLMELLVSIKSPQDSAVPTCAAIAPDGNIWIGSIYPALVTIYKADGSFYDKAKLPNRWPLIAPTDIAIARGNDSVFADYRLHLLDKESGRVYVYDLAGNLTLVYPRDRKLKQPLAIDISEYRRHIYIVEGATAEITIFGY